MSTSLNITFSFEAGVPPSESDQADRLHFWNLPTTIEWFKSRGYTLYECIDEETTKAVLPVIPDNDAKYPWAYYETEPCEHESIIGGVVQVFEPPGKVAYAQDSSNRHVAIKVIHADTDEYRVLRFLHEQNMDTLKENCVVPVLDLLPTEGYWFAVMPRWGTHFWFPYFTYLYEPLDVIHSMLKACLEFAIFSCPDENTQGLVFLHKNNIAHGDIMLENVLVNQFCSDVFYNEIRGELRREQRLSYALFDFDFSAMLPLGANKQDFRLPYDRSFGSFNISGDTDTGEYEYDPFAFDVGTMGVRLYRQFDSLTPVFPGFAPLFDKMTTWDIRRRFTATEAFEFFQSLVSELSADQLLVCIEGQSYAEVPKDLWECVPADLIERWKIYKTLPEPWSRRLLCWICRRRWMNHVVPWTRWFSFHMFSVFPCRVYRWFFPSKIIL